MAWTRPRMYKPKMVSSRLIQKSLPMPTCRKTPRGGNRIAQMIFTMSISSLQYVGIIKVFGQTKRKREQNCRTDYAIPFANFGEINFNSTTKIQINFPPFFPLLHGDRLMKTVLTKVNKKVLTERDPFHKTRVIFL